MKNCFEKNSRLESRRGIMGCCLQEGAGMTDFGLDEYQRAAHETAKYGHYWVYPVLGLVGEAGELANKFKKLIRDRNLRSVDQVPTEARAALVAELGDCLWYLAEIAFVLNTSLSEVGRRNIAKLQDRDSRGKIGGDGDDR